MAATHGQPCIPIDRSTDVFIHRPYLATAATLNCGRVPEHPKMQKERAISVAAAVRTKQVPLPSLKVQYSGGC